MEHQWDAEHYDDKLSFVSDLGRRVVSLLRPQPGENILDLGCGTGDLTNEIAHHGAFVVGIDRSESMIKQAREKYPNLRFSVGNGEAFHLEQPVDAVFSNAALHWMRHPSKVIERVWHALLPGGRFVAEFGGKGNVKILLGALERARDELGIKATQGQGNPWYFPSIGEYASLLEQKGFCTTYAAHFDRPTEMPDGDRGFEYWIEGFAESYLMGLDSSTRAYVIRRAAEWSRPSLYKEGKWFVDYKRLRIVAVKS